MPLLDVLPPEVFGLEQLGAFWDLTAEFGFIFLLHEFGQLLIQRLGDWLPAQLLQVDRLGLQQLQNFVLERLHPVESSQQLLIRLVMVSVRSSFLDWTYWLLGFSIIEI